MRPIVRLVLVAAEAAFLVTVGWFGAAFFAAKFLPQANGPTIAQESIIGVAFATFLGLAAWATFRQLRAHYPRREVRALTIAVVIFVPLSTLFSMPLVQFFVTSGGRHELFAALVLALGAMTAIVTCAACFVVLWITRRIERVERIN